MSSLLTREGGASSEREQVPELEPARMVPRIGVAESIRRHPVMAAAPAVVLVLLALAYGLLRTPTYTAEAYQSIGRIDVNQPGALSGFQQATETLATTYSRAIRSTSVVRTVARRTGLTTAEVRARLWAYPVPESSVFVVAATGPSPNSAINLSRRGTIALRGYIKRLNTRNPNGARLYRRYRQATYERSRMRDRFERMRRTFGADVTPAERRSLARARARLDAATLRRTVAGRNYAATQGGQSMVSLVQDLALPETASSNRFKRLQLLLFIALSAGVLLGLALATITTNREVRRSFSVS